MRVNQITMNPNGIFYMLFNSIKSFIAQYVEKKEVMNCVGLFTKRQEGLTDLAEFLHIALLYHLYKINNCNLLVKPFMDTKKHSIFATKSPKLPNAMELSIVKLLEIKNNINQAEMADKLKGKPLIHIKMFFAKIYNRISTKSVWLDNQLTMPINKLRFYERFKL